MKKSRYLVLAIWLVSNMFFYSCDDFLAKEPFDFLPAESYYDTPEKLQTALVGVYDVLGNGSIFGREMQFRMGFECDEGYYSRISPAIGPQVYNFEAGQRSIFMYWQSFYQGIDRANLLLYHLDNFEADESLKGDIDRIRGEAQFLRGFYYFWLVQTFGGVPLITEPTTDLEKIDIPKATIGEVYEQILKDMTEAETRVLDIRDIGAGGQVSKSAVRGLLARVCLYMAGEPLKDTSKYADARDWALKVIEDSDANHSLNPSYMQVFINYAQDKYDINESIWEIEFYGNNESAYSEAGAIGQVNGIMSRDINNYGDGFGGIRVTHKLYDSYTIGDVRKDWNVSNFQVLADGAIRFEANSLISDIYKLYSGKYRREYELVYPKSRSYTPTNFPLLRYSDVLLMFAEADNEVNGTPTQAAIDAINEVRLRSVSTGIKTINITSGGTGYITPPTVLIEGANPDNLRPIAVISNGSVSSIYFDKDRVYGEARGTGFTAPPAISFSGGGGSGAEAVAVLFEKEDFKITDFEASSNIEFRQSIQDERMRELSFELLRKGDLIRWGIFVYEMNQVGQHIIRFADATVREMAVGYNNASERHLLWPIPTKEITLNRALRQNPGW